MEILYHYSSDIFIAQITVAVLVTAGLCCQSLVTFFGDTEFNSFALWQGDESLSTLSDDEDVRQTGGKHVTVGIFHMDNLERSRMLLTVDDSTNTTQISSASDHHKISCKIFVVVFSLK